MSAKPAQQRIRKAVFPVAGLGTRFLPATKAMPKEMLTVVDRPVIQHVVDEARAAGIEHFIFVTGRNKGVIEDHFDIQFELEATLSARGNKKAELAELARDQPAAGQTSFTRQQAPLGLGHAVWCARELVGNEPFALLLPDMLHHGATGCLAEMIAAYNEHGGNHIAVAPVPDDQTHQYGIVGVADRAAKVSQITRMVEKPPNGSLPRRSARSASWRASSSCLRTTGSRASAGRLVMVLAFTPANDSAKALVLRCARLMWPGSAAISAASRNAGSRCSSAS